MTAQRGEISAKLIAQPVFPSNYMIAVVSSVVTQVTTGARGF